MPKNPTPAAEQPESEAVEAVEVEVVEVAEPTFTNELAGVSPEFAHAKDRL